MNGASLNFHLKGIRWGAGYGWETFIPEVNPISYAAFGNLRQFQHNELDIADDIATMMRVKYGGQPLNRNVPNAYMGVSHK